MICNNSRKATVTYTDIYSVKTEFIYTDNTNAGIEISCTDESKIGRFIFTLNDYGYTPSNDGYTFECGSSGQLFTNKIIADSYKVTGTTSPGFYENCPWYEISFFIENEKISSYKRTLRYNIFEENNPNYSKGGKFLKIKNFQQIQIFRAEVDNCNYKVACGDDCPEGFCKCPIPEYPGYCCLDCNVIAQELRIISNELRAKNV